MSSDQQPAATPEPVDEQPTGVIREALTRVYARFAAIDSCDRWSGPAGTTELACRQTSIALDGWCWSCLIRRLLADRQVREAAHEETKRSLAAVRDELRELEDRVREAIRGGINDAAQGSGDTTPATPTAGAAGRRSP